LEFPIHDWVDTLQDYVTEQSHLPHDQEAKERRRDQDPTLATLVGPIFGRKMVNMLT
jgi:hypothetical protein